MTKRDKIIRDLVGRYPSSLFIPVGKEERNLFAIVDVWDFAKLFVLRWGVRQAGRSGHYAHLVEPKAPPIAMHRMIIRPPNGLICDHINGNGLDNRRINLRSCTIGQNNLNRRPSRNSDSGVSGVQLRDTRDGPFYFVTMSVDGRMTKLGKFRTFDEACAVRYAAEIEHHGEFRHQPQKGEYL